MKYVAKRTITYENIDLPGLTARTKFCFERGSIVEINPEIVLILLEKAALLKEWQEAAAGEELFPE